MVERLALAKLRAVVVAGETGLAADTVVVVDGEVLGKPGTPERAGEMLRRLSGRAHQVVGGIAMRRYRYDASGVVRTRVTMRAMTDEEIADFNQDREAVLANPVAKGFIDSQQSMKDLQKTPTTYLSLTFELGRCPTADEVDESQNASGGCCGGGGGGGGCCS